MRIVRLAGKWRWRIVAMLFALSAINYLDRQTLSVLAPDLRDRFGISNQQYSYIVTAFLVAYTFGFGLCGPVLNRVGVKVALGCAVLFWSGAAMLHVFSRGWIGLAVCRFFLGLGESFGPVGGAKAIGEWAPRRERSTSMAVFSTGNIAGAIIAPPLVTATLLHFGWQAAFLLTGSIGLLWLAGWMRWYDSPERSRHLSGPEREFIMTERRAGIAPASDWRLLANPLCYGLFTARLLTDSVPYFFSFWLPEYLHRSRDLSIAMIGFVAWIPYLAADAGGLSGGILSDWLVRHGLSAQRARMTVLFGAACITPLAAVAVRTKTASAAITCIALVLAAHSAWIVNLLTAMTESFPQGQVATAIGISGVGGGIGGILANLATGHVIPVYGYGPIFSVLGFVHFTSFLILMAARHYQTRAASVSEIKP